MKASSPPRSLLPPGHPHPSRTAGMPLVPAQIFRETQAGTPRRDFGRAGTGGAERVRARAGDPHCNIPESMNPHPLLGLLDLWDLLCSGKAPLPSHSLESALPQLGRGDGTGAIPKAFSQNEPRPGARHGLGWARSPWDGHRTLGWARMPWDGHVSHWDGHTSRMESAPSGHTGMALLAPGTAVVPEPPAPPEIQNYSRQTAWPGSF